MRLVLLGPPGAGKGTQGLVLSRKYNIPHISTGDILRDAVKGALPLGKSAKAFMEKGSLVPDEIVTGIVIERLKKGDVEKGFILDGFPRTLKQAHDLDGALSDGESRMDLVLYFETSSRVAIERLSGRRVCKACGRNFHIKNIPPSVEGICDKCGGELFQRPDDKEETVRNRLKVYEDQTKPLVEYYDKKGILRKVSGDLNVDSLLKILSDIFAVERLA
ncbi:MAG: adenylate kinase [Candidatus Omnitrophota bacterium]|nr:adenylate kinase [Candidatus Omnitrophota bacterium]